MNPRTASLIALSSIIVGILIQILGGSDTFPVVPPGIVLTLVAMISVIVARPRWITNLAWIIPTILLTGGLLTDPGLLTILQNPVNQVVFAGAVIVAISYVAAIITGAMLVMSRNDDREGASIS